MTSVGVYESSFMADGSPQSAPVTWTGLGDLLHDVLEFNTALDISASGLVAPARS